MSEEKERMENEEMKTNSEERINMGDMENKLKETKPGKQAGQNGTQGDLEELKQLLKEREQEISELKDRLLRLGAEFENFKKRMEREKEEYMKYALEAFAKELLPFLDNLERAIQTAKENPDVEKILEGLELTLSGYFTTLEKFGLKQFVAEGKRFDPNFHEALGVEEHDGVEENTVIKELLKGYTLHERVIRPALVVVSKKSQKKGSGQTESDA